MLRECPRFRWIRLFQFDRAVFLIACSADQPRRGMIGIGISHSVLGAFRAESRTNVAHWIYVVTDANAPSPAAFSPPPLNLSVFDVPVALQRMVRRCGHCE